MMRHEAQEWYGMIERNKQRADTCAGNEKKYCSCSFILIRIYTILSKNIWNNFQNLLFKNFLTQSGDQTDIFWKFYLSVEMLWSLKTVGRVLGYTTACIRKMVEILFPDSFIKNQNWAYLWINSLTFYTVCFCWMASWGL